MANRNWMIEDGVAFDDPHAAARARACRRQPRRLSRLSGAVVLAMLAACILPEAVMAMTLMGRVTETLDCDVVVLYHQRQKTPIRLHGIDCPEKGQPHWREARRYTSFMTVGLEVTVLVVGKDDHGQYVGDVVLPDGRMLNPLIIEEGLGWWDRSPTSDHRLAELQELAQASKKGLWQDPYPIPPWEWRKGRRAPEP